MDDDIVTREEFDRLRIQLDQSSRLVEDNNKILHAMRKWGRIAFAAKVIIWTIVLILPVLLYPLISPFISGTGGTAASSSSTSLFGFPTPEAIQKAIHPGSSSSK